MKKTILAASVLSLFLTTNLVLANNLNEVVPSDTGMYFEFNTKAKNPIQEYFIKEMPNQFAKSIFSNEDEVKQKDNLEKTLQDILSSSTLALGISFPDDVSAGLKVTDTQFQNFLNALGSNVSIESENPKIYLTRDDFFFTKSGDLLIAAPTKEKILSVLNNNESKLSTNANYKEISSDFSSDDNFVLYLSSSIFESIFKYGGIDSDMTKTFTDYLKASGFTVKKTSTGISSKIITLFNPEKAKELGLNSTANNFTPVLYKVMPNENPIFYTEFSNLKYTIESTIGLLLKTGEFDAADLDIPTDVETYLSILEKEIAIYIQKDAQILPAITIVLNTSSHKNLATEIVTKLTSALEDELDKQGTNYEKSTIKGFTTFTFDINKLDKESKIPEGMNEISVTLGLTPENYLLFSTYSKITSKYGEGLTKNAEFKKSFSSLTETVASITYFNIENLATWYDQILTTADKITTTSFTKQQITTTRSLLKKVRKPWHDISITKKNTNTKSTSEINLNVDLSEIDLTYLETVDDFFNITEKTVESFKNSRETFNDTLSSDWYYDDVKELSARGVIKGYEDNSFKPNNQITRAEFLIMVLRASGNDNFDDNSGFLDEYPQSNFRDVKPSDWFSKAVEEGTSNGLIKGYSDNSFHPNSPITRAEATALLNKMIKFKYGEDISLPVRAFSDPFSDVKPSDWYYEDVQRIYGYSIIDGDSNGSSFSPNRNLNRAEASKIINKALKGMDSLPKFEYSFPQ